MEDAELAGQGGTTDLLVHLLGCHLGHGSTQSLGPESAMDAQIALGV